MSPPSPDDLAPLALFACVPAEGLDIFAEAAEVRPIPAGEVIYREGEPGDAIYLVVAGRVEVVAGATDRVLNVIEAGDFFGEMSFVDMQPRSATVRAETDVVLWRWPYTTLAEIRRTDLRAFTILFMNLAREISRRLRRADARLSE